MACHDDLGYDIKHDPVDETIRFLPKRNWQHASDNTTSTRGDNTTVSFSDASVTGNPESEVSETLEIPEYRKQAGNICCERTDNSNLIAIVALDQAEGNNTTDSLFLHIYEEDMPEFTADKMPDTRGSLIDSIYDSFSITAMRYEGKWSEGKCINYFHDEKYVHNPNSGQWTGENVYNWTGRNDSIRFYGVMPYGAVTLSDSRLTTAPTFDYTLPTDINKQIDLLATKPTALNGNYNKEVGLNFEHILSAVRIQEGDGIFPGSISSISIENAPCSGTYDFEVGKWTNLGDPETYTLIFDDLYKVKETDGASITSEDQIFFLIPAETDSSKPMRLSMTHITDGEYNNKNTQTSRNLSVNLDINFKPGKTYTLKISTASLVSERILQFRNAIDVSYSNYDNAVYNKSFSTYVKISREGGEVSYRRLGCSLKYFGYNPSTDEYDIPMDTPPEWIEFNRVNSKYYDTANGYPVTMFQYKTPMKNALFNREKEYLEKLQAKSFGSTSDPYDLSVDPETGEQESANCYIVNGYGYFKMPVCSGNLLKNQDVNEKPMTQLGVSSSYYSASIYEFSLAQKDSDGKVLMSRLGEGYHSTRPYLSDLFQLRNWNCFMNAELIWETTKGLVTDIRLSDDNFYLTFRIPKEKITQGNALISVRNEYGYLWSWHIWVTPHTSDDDVKYGSYTHLGILGARDISYSVPDGAEKFRVEVTLDKEKESDVDKTISFLCTPPPEDMNKRMVVYFPSFQFERPIPLVPIGGAYDKAGNTFPCQGYEVVHDFTMTADNYWNGYYEELYNYAIFYPQYMNTGTPLFKKSNDSWNKGSGIGNLWFGQYVSSPFKTVCDPCPRGYRIMKYAELSNFRSGLQNSIKNSDSDYPYSALIFDTNDKSKSIMIPWTLYTRKLAQAPGSDYLGWWFLDNELDQIELATNLNNSNKYTTTPNVTLSSYSSDASNQIKYGNGGYAIIPVKE